MSKSKTAKGSAKNFFRKSMCLISRNYLLATVQDELEGLGCNWDHDPGLQPQCGNEKSGAGRQLGEQEYEGLIDAEDRCRAGMVSSEPGYLRKPPERNNRFRSIRGCQLNCVTGTHTGTLSPNRMTN
jgi:hypothetical protein